jgi:hypothetical protein
MLPVNDMVSADAARQKILRSTGLCLVRTITFMIQIKSGGEDENIGDGRVYALFQHEHLKHPILYEGVN